MNNRQVASPILLILTFVESFATILTERATYFYTSEVLGYSDVTNLWIALGLGTAYVVGAKMSGAASTRWGERGMLFATIVGQFFVHLAIFYWPSGWVLVGGLILLGGLNGLKWPVVESYVSAGKTPREAATAVGRFNMAWSSAVPLSLIAAGPIIASQPTWLFLLAGGINLVALGLVFAFPKRPVHLADDHPERPVSHALRRMSRLLVSSRWSMLSSYSLLFLMSPLLPGVFGRLGVPVAVATALVALLDVLRVCTFAALRHWTGWHDRSWPLLAAAVILPLGFFMTLFGPTLVVVLSGEVLFGIATGLSYYAALYYAMVVANASVDAGGSHEGMIGLGFTAGPAVGLVGVALAAPLGSALVGMTVAVAPLMVLTLGGGLRPLRTRVDESTQDGI